MRGAGRVASGWTRMGRKAESSSKGPFGGGGMPEAALQTHTAVLRALPHLHHGSTGTGGIA